jgi:hypothetical protein
VVPRSFVPLNAMRRPSGANAGLPSSAVTAGSEESPLPSAAITPMRWPASNTILAPSREYDGDR